MQSITIAGGIHMAIGALALEVRYRFVGLLRVRLLTTIAVIAALVARPPTLWVVVGLLFPGCSSVARGGCRGVGTRP